MRAVIQKNQGYLSHVHSIEYYLTRGKFTKRRSKQVSLMAIVFGLELFSDVTRRVSSCEVQQMCVDASFVSRARVFNTIRTTKRVKRC